MIYKNVLECIGHTPLIELNKINKTQSRVLVKAEFMNPGGSMKDRPALNMIEEAEKSGALKKGQTVMEVTSGNTGIGLAMVCAVKGYKFKVLMSVASNPERQKILKAYGAELVLVPQCPTSTPGVSNEDDFAKVKEYGEELAKDPNIFYVRQFTNENNSKAYEKTLAKEIVEQLGKSPDYFTAVVGTSGNFIGTATGLKAISKDTKCIVAESEGMEVIAGKEIKRKSTKLQGAAHIVVPKLWKSEVNDGVVVISDEEAKMWANKLAKEEGLLVGYTSGGNVAAAMKLAEKAKPGSTIVTLLPDSGSRYFASDLFVE